MKYGINQFLYLEVVHLHCRLTVPSMPDIYTKQKASLGNTVEVRLLQGIGMRAINKC